jgi:hypothetical protein
MVPVALKFRLPKYVVRQNIYITQWGSENQTYKIQTFSVPVIE